MPLPLFPPGVAGFCGCVDGCSGGEVGCEGVSGCAGAVGFVGVSGCVGVVGVSGLDGVVGWAGMVGCAGVVGGAGGCSGVVGCAGAFGSSASAGVSGFVEGFAGFVLCDVFIHLIVFFAFVDLTDFCLVDDFCFDADVMPSEETIHFPAWDVYRVKDL